MTPEDRAKRLLAMLVDELGIPDWQRGMVGLWVQDERSAAVAAERVRWRQIVADLWRFTTGEEWDEMTEEGAAAESETLLGLFRRIREGGAA